MKTCFAFPLFAAALLLTAATTHAKDAAKVPDDLPKLPIVVIENLQRQRGAITAFDRLDLAFQQVARQRKWPMAIAAERFASNTPAHETELRIFTQPLRKDTPGELTFRGWMILTVQGVKHDFGIISFRYSMRPFEQGEDVLDKIFLGAANTAADKIEPLLFREPDAPKT